MIQSSWSPRLATGSGPVWRQLVEALGADIRSEALPAGTRLPPQRTLAFQLGIGVGTVTRAYEEAERTGLVESRVGRGTFVAGPRVVARAGAQGPIDMAHNVPPIAPALCHIAETLDRLRQRNDLVALADYTSTVGVEAARVAGARWLNTVTGVVRSRPEQLIQTGGGQCALALALSSFARAGDTILCDRATYPGNGTLAAHGGWLLGRVEADAEGMDPAALDRAAAESGARLLILIPTLHNPTTITLSRRRREEIVEVARRRDLLIVEDDIYRVFGEDDTLPPLAELAPERTIHVASVSKALAPGLRLAFVLPPQDRAVADRLLLAQQASAYCPPSAGALMFAQWMEDGLAEAILDAVRAEAACRLQLAQTILGTAIAAPPSARSLHVWLPMESGQVHAAAAAALRDGVEVTPPDAPFGRSEDIDGLRLCLGGADDLDQLERALRVVASALARGSGHARGIV